MKCPNEQHDSAFQEIVKAGVNCPICEIDRLKAELAAAINQSDHELANARNFIAKLITGREKAEAELAAATGEIREREKLKNDMEGSIEMLTDKLSKIRALVADVVDDLTVDATVDGDRWREMLKIRIAERGPIDAGRGEGTR